MTALCRECSRSKRRTCTHPRRVCNYTHCPYCGCPSLGLRVDGRLVRHEYSSGSVPKIPGYNTKANVCPASERTPAEAAALWERATVKPQWRLGLLAGW